MALISCPECGRQVSEIAESCPQCGAPVAKNVSTKNNFTANKKKNRVDNSLSENEQLMAELNPVDYGQPIQASKSSHSGFIWIAIIIGFFLLIKILSSGSSGESTSASTTHRKDTIYTPRQERIIKAAAENSAATEQEMREAMDAFYGKN